MALRADPGHPLTAGHLCGKVAGYLTDRVYHPARLTRALRRAGTKGEGRFVEVDLAQALDEIADRLSGIVAACGPAAVLPFSYEGTQGLLQSKSVSERFFARMGASELLRTMCGPTGGAGVAAVNGATVGVLPEDVEHARLVVVWGANPIVTNQHLWPAVSRARAAGARLVVIDPVTTRTARTADWHLAPRPGSDAALALGLAQVIIERGMVDHDFVDRYTAGFADLAEAVAWYTPGRVAELTDLPAQDIVALALAYATAQPAVIRLMVGMEHHARGSAAYTAIAALPALTGAWRHLGGGLAYHTSPLFAQALNLAGLAMPQLASGPRRKINMVHLGRALTDPDLDPPVQALVVHGSNPAVVAPRQPLVRAGLAREDLFTVVHDHVLTDTARYADIVLPATTQVEHLDLMRSWGHVDLVLNNPAVRPPGQAIGVTTLFRELAARMGYTEPCFCDTDEELLATALDSAHPYLAGITVDSLARNGWQRLNVPRPYVPFAYGFPTPDGRARLSEAARVARDNATAGGPPDPRWPLRVLSVKGLRSMNSTYADTTRGQRDGGPWVDLHPDDAATRGIRDGDPVRVSTQDSAIALYARVGDRVPAGVVAIVFGTWTVVGDRTGGATVNLLTCDHLTEAGGSAYHDTFVEITRQSAASPAEDPGVARKARSGGIDG